MVHAAHPAPLSPAGQPGPPFLPKLFSTPDILCPQSCPSPTRSYPQIPCQSLRHWGRDITGWRAEAPAVFSCALHPCFYL